MKKILFAFILTVGAATVHGQNQGPHINAGLGLNDIGIPIYGSYDWGFRDDFNLGVGASLGTGGNDYDGGIFGVGFFTQWYADRILDIPSDFDVYAGLGVFYYTFKNGDDLDLGLFVGGRYYFNDRMGVNLELGAGSTLAGAKIGVSWLL